MPTIDPDIELILLLDKQYKDIVEQKEETKSSLSLTGEKLFIIIDDRDEKTFKGELND